MSKSTGQTDRLGEPRPARCGNTKQVPAENTLPAVAGERPADA